MAMEYSPREVDRQLEKLLVLLPAVAVEGAKGVGKTASVERIAGEIFSLDQESTFLNVVADPELILKGTAPIFIDEWQRVPSVWDVVRRAVDRGATSGTFVLAGSASPSQKTAIHSGAGRIVRVMMRPMTIPERRIEQPTVSFANLLAGDASDMVQGRTDVATHDYVEEILASGFPGIRSQQAEARPYLLDGYLERIVDRDIPEAGATVRRPVALRNWLAAYGAATATAATDATIFRAASPSGNPVNKQTAASYRELLQRIWVLDPVPAWEPGFAHLKRLGQASKHHLVDPALAARLVGATAGSLIKGVGDPDFPRDGTFLGALFESLVVQTVRVLAESCGASIAHIRTRDGDHEVDIIVQRPDFRVLAIEVKMSTAVKPSDVTQLNWLEQQLPNRLIDKVIINAGSRAFRRPDGVAVVPLGLLGP